MKGSWTPKRAAAVVRRADGTIKKWKGGKDLKDLPKQQNNFHGIAVHIGMEYKRQHGKTATIGSIVRTKNKDGSYNQQAYWYIKTPKGWRRSKTLDIKPTKAQIAEAMATARTGRK